MSYVDIQLVGTTTGSSTGIRFEANTFIVGSSGQSWTLSVFTRIIAGSTSGFTNIVLNIFGRTAGNVPTGDSNSSASVTSTLSASSLRLNRRVHTFTLADALTERVSGQLLFGHLSGSAIDLTLRIAAPQLEEGAFATSYIPTTTAAATRATEAANVESPNFASAYNNTEGTLFGEYIFGNSVPSIRMLQVDDTTSSNRLCLALTSFSTPQNFGQTGGATVLSSSPATGAITVGAIYKTAAAFATDNMIAASNGTLGTLDSSGAMPVGPLGRVQISGNTARGHWIRKVAYYPRRLSNALLQQLTT